MQELMRKTFKQMMLEADEQYEYYIRSVVNIHEYDTMEMLRLSLLPYQLVELKTAGFHPIDKSNEFFPQHPNTPTYSLKAKLDLPIEDANAIIQKIATFIKVNDEYLTFYEVGSDPLKRWDDPEMEEDEDGEYIPMGSTDPENKATVDKYATPDADAQKEVGYTRIDAFMKELEDDKKEREGAGREREVYESFVIPHDVASSIVGKPQATGYYIVERFNNSKFKITGAFKSIPDNYRSVFKSPYSITNSEVISESYNGKHKEIDMILEYTKVRENSMGASKFEVVVTQVDNGRKFNMVVTARDDTTARDKAISQVARQHSVDPNSLIAEQPE